MRASSASAATAVGRTATAVVGGGEVAGRLLLLAQNEGRARRYRQVIGRAVEVVG